MTARRVMGAVAIVLSMSRLYGSAPSDEARVAVLSVAIVGALSVLFIGRRTASSAEDNEQADQDAADPTSRAPDAELREGSAVRGGGLRGVGGTLSLDSRALTFRHLRGEVVIPIEQIAQVTKRRTLGLFDNQLVLALRDRPREVFQIPEHRNGWYEALAALTAARGGAYR